MYQKKLVRLGINYLFYWVGLAYKIQGFFGSIASQSKEKGYSQILYFLLPFMLPKHSHFGLVASIVKVHRFGFSHHCLISNEVKQDLVFNTQSQINEQYSTTF